MTSESASAGAPGQAEREALRARHQVRALTDEEEGASVQRLPAGVYGFTSTPGLHDGPLFKLPKYHTFEVHRLLDGEVVLIGFVSPETIAALESGSDDVPVYLFPDPVEQAPHVVTIPLSRIARIKEHSTREEGALRLEVSPEREQLVN